jgi:hypothetical protein
MLMIPRKIKEDEVNVHVVGMEGEIYTYKTAVVKPEGNRAIGRPKRGWENNFLKRTLKIYARRKWTGAIWFRIGTTLKDISLFSKASRRAVGRIKTFIARVPRVIARVPRALSWGKG